MSIDITHLTELMSRPPTPYLHGGFGGRSLRGIYMHHHWRMFLRVRGGCLPSLRTRSFDWFAGASEDELYLDAVAPAESFVDKKVGVTRVR